MTVVYRTIWNDARPDLFPAVRAEFNAWLKDKEIPLELPADNGEVTAGKYTVRMRSVSNEEVSALRAEFIEDYGNRRWKTMLLAMHDTDGQHVWVDTSWVSDNVYAATPKHRSPKLVRSLIDNGTAHVGPNQLRTTALTTSSSDIDDLVATVTRPDREVPIVVVAMANGQNLSDMQRRARTLAAALAGVADVRLLVPTSVGVFNQAMGEGMAVFNGSVRTYLPGAQVADPANYRHRFITRERVEKHDDAALEMLTRALFRTAANRRPPLVYRKSIHAQLRDGMDVDSLWELVTEFDQDNEELRSQLELEQLEHDDVLTVLNSARRRIRYLEAQLTKANVHDIEDDSAESAIPDNVDSLEEAVELARIHLQYVALPDAACGDLRSLDSYPNATTWAKKAWAALRALEEYARLKRTGTVSGDFRKVLCDGDLGTYAIPVKHVAMSESETTDQTPRFRRARTLAVPEAVDSSGALYMPSHIKLSPGGSPAPRIHFHDDTRGPTGIVHVGWFGDHLDNRSTN